MALLLLTAGSFASWAQGQPPATTAPKDAPRAPAPAATAPPKASEAKAPETKAPETKAPEAATGRTEKVATRAKRFMVAAANPVAAKAGYDILKSGGSAVDAAIAIQLVLNLVEPQSSGIGGGAFMLHYTASEGKIRSYDGRETAPAAAKPDRFMRPDGKPMEFAEAVVGGKSVGVPGLVRMMELAHRNHGRLPWAELFAPAIKLAEDGFEVSPRLNDLLSKEQQLIKFAPAKTYFYEADGKPKAVGTKIRNPDLAAVFRLIAQNGADAFYKGAVAQDIVAAVTKATVNPGDMTEADLAGYQAKERDPVCGDYRRWKICGMGPPSSGGMTVYQIMKLMEPFPVAKLKPDSAEAVHLMSEAGRLAYADRGLYMGDADFIPVPVTGLMNPEYLKSRSKLLQMKAPMEKVEAGVPPQKTGWNFAPDRAQVLTGTSHIVVIDRFGNAVSMTTTIEDGFGSRTMVRGFLLNNQLTDFSFNPTEGGKPVANRLEAGKRPRSSMAPTLVLDQKTGRLIAAVGSPGGSAIINYVAKTLLGILDWRLDPQTAVALPNVGSRGGPIELEQGTAAEGLKTALEAMGHKTRVIELNSGIQVIARPLKGGGWVGGADPRREGIALGD